MGASRSKHAIRQRGTKSPFISTRSTASRRSRDAVSVDERKVWAMTEDKQQTLDTPTLPLLAIFADESCLGNGREGSNPGGAAGVIEYMNPDTGNLTRWDYWISEPG